MKPLVIDSTTKQAIVRLVREGVVNTAIDGIIDAYTARLIGTRPEAADDREMYYRHITTAGDFRAVLNNFATEIEQEATTGQVIIPED